MPDTIKKFLLDLSSGKNAALETNFRKDPVGTMTANGVTKDMQSLVLKGDSKALATSFRPTGGGKVAEGDNVVVVVVVL